MKTRWLLLLRLLLLASAGIVLQPGRGLAAVLDDTLVTVGTTARDSQNRDWSYLLFQPSDVTRLRNRKIALYAKTGAADSASAYERKSITGIQTDPAVIGVLLNRAVNLGDNLGELEEQVDDLFASILPAGNFQLSDKLSAVIRGSLDRPEHFANLVLLGRLHAGVNLSLGFAFAEQIPPGSKFTYEAREFDLAANKDIGVLGRVTVEAGKPGVLPAPGAPFRVPNSGPKDNLNARFRWGTSADLRRLTLLQHGFNLYRVTRAYAEGQNYHLAPPAPDVLAKLMFTQPKSVKRVNRLPVLQGRTFSLPDPQPDDPKDPDVDDLAADASTAYVGDDNGLGDDDHVPFKDGEQFYYFVAARDVLGRDGVISPGTLVTMCDRIFPSAPRLPRVENDYRVVNDKGVQRLKVTWRQRPSTPDETITGYYVYRWSNPADVQKYGGIPNFNQISGLIPHQPGKATLTFVDDGGGAPTQPADNGKTYWYTVRAVDAGVCDGGNLSPHSAPAFGVLRDREGPSGPLAGGPEVMCCTPVAQPDGSTDLEKVGLNIDRAYFDLVCVRDNRDTAWAEFYWFGNAPSNLIARVHFPAHTDRIVRRVSLRRADFGANASVDIYCRTGDFEDDPSQFAKQELKGLPSQRSIREVRFFGRERCGYTALTLEARRSGCNGHNPHPGGHGGGDGGAGTNQTAGVKLKWDLTPGTQEWKVYRRIDAGDLTLIRQDTNAPAATEAEMTDQDLPANACTACYYAQLFDQHGNASPMTPLGECVEIQRPGPKPVLGPLVAVGDKSNPQMTIRWVCAPQGVERFEILLSAKPGNPPFKLSPLLSENLAAPQNQILMNGGDPEDSTDWAVYHTPAIQSGFGEGGGTFSITVPVKLGVEYHVQVGTIPFGHGPSRYSTLRGLKWGRGPASGGPGVPWPARELAPVGEPVAGVIARKLDASVFKGVGVRIGAIPASNVVNTAFGLAIRGFTDPKEFTYTDTNSLPLVPGFVLYRYQVANDAFPKVSGDLSQVSPLIERIAHSRTNVAQGAVTWITDPFIRLTFPPSFPPNQPYEMYLVDTQPVVRKASYAYVLARFGRNGELDELVPVEAVKVD